MGDGEGYALVTGATGFTGGHLARALRRRGYRVRALVRQAEFVAGASARRRRDRGRRGRRRGCRGDRPAPSREPRHVFHIAAVYRSANHPDSYYYAVNRDSVAHVLAAAQQHVVGRIVHCSTCGVHGDVAEIPATEETAFNPSDIYQESKLAGEMLAREAIAAGAPVSIVRPTGIYGPGDTRFLKLFRTIENRTFRMVGSGEIAYHMSYIDDLVRGLHPLRRASRRDRRGLPHRLGQLHDAERARARDRGDARRAAAQGPHTRRAGDGGGHALRVRLSAARDRPAAAPPACLVLPQGARLLGREGEAPDRLSSRRSRWPRGSTRTAEWYREMGYLRGLPPRWRHER